MGAKPPNVNGRVNAADLIGFTRTQRSDLIGAWTWQWGKEGRIEFTLAGNGSMIANLFPAKGDIIYKLSNWGEGDWQFERGRLVITMRRVGKRGLPGSVEHLEVWIDARVEEAATDEILLEATNRLTRITKD